MNPENMFHVEKQRICDRLGCALRECESLQHELSIDLSAVLAKIQQGLTALSQERVIIAVFGPFSDGKSSILAALTGRLDIKIAPEPTTDRVRLYETEDWLVCDMPGLFSEKEAHTEQALRHVAEAHIVLFVVDAVNPLKESHHQLARWLFEDLGKGDALVFVINKMDMVADLEDATDFEHHARLKAEVVRETLFQVLGRVAPIPVVAIAANPYNRGLPYWRLHAQEYQELSRLGVLEKYMDERVRAASQQLILASGMSTLRDAVLRTAELVRAMHTEVEPSLSIFNNQVREVSAEMERLERHMVDAYAGIKAEALEKRRHLMMDLDACEGLPQVASFLQREIGQDGHILDQNLEIIVHRHTQALGAEVVQAMQDIGRSLETHEGLLSELGKVMNQPLVRGALGTLQATSASELAHGILWLRDMLSLPIRFKPWGAIKLGRVIKLLAWLGPVLEGGQLLADWLSERKLKHIVPEIKDRLEEGFRHFLEEFSVEKYGQAFFPQLPQLRQLSEQLRQQQQEYRALSGRLAEAELRLKKLLS